MSAICSTVLNTDTSVKPQNTIIMIIINNQSSRI